MHCRICGSEKNTKYYPDHRQTLCKGCAKDTPPKVSRSVFDAFYWDNPNADDPPESVKREFYFDYLTSTYTLEEYKIATTFDIL